MAGLRDGVARGNVAFPRPSASLQNSGIMQLLIRVIPVIFVILWSTGFIGAKFGMPYAEPFTFLAIRMLITLAILLPIVWLFVRQKPDMRTIGHSMIAGMLIHACYLGAIFFAISKGMSAGISSLIVAVQPLLTAIIAWAMLNERVSRRQVIAFIAALGGVVLVLSPRLTMATQDQGINLVTVSSCFFAVIAISVGSVYQKRFVSIADLRAGAAGQYLGALVPLALLSFLFESREVEWTGEFIFAMAWLVLVLSLGAVSLLMFLIRRDSAAQTASLFYLVPVFTAIIAYFLFGETLGLVQLAGMAIVVVSVAMAARKPRQYPKQA